ncbi:MAG TPA: hypothetical protein VG148_01595 [Pyrinomonadaceae bacterium]|nr:hypothetical protein [Pyrinomonadaceae bacterium]
MRRLSLTLCLVAVLAWSGSHSPAGRRAAAQQSPQETDEPGPDERERRRKEFKPAKDLLEKKGVPFEAETLLDPDWRARLAPAFAGMAEMRAERRAGRRLKGVQLADTLYLPEKVELTEDTVIIARNVLHEGRDAVIKGNHNIYIYPIEAWGLLGTTAEAARKEAGRSARVVRAGLRGSPPKRFVPRLIADGTLTIDTSSTRYDDWYRRELRRVEPSRVGFRKASFGGQSQDQSGQDMSGFVGPEGAVGELGPKGDPDPSLKGDDGNCLGDGVNGKPGFSGPGGGAGGVGFEGGKGPRGGDVGTIVAEIKTISGTYVFKAAGGQGGKGGTGGRGGTGGTGAQGGQGGTGASCSCPPGNGGMGGLGGKAGKGGKGGTGGPGGDGGDGGPITVRIPRNFYGTYVYYINAGPAGYGGAQGPGGFPGVPGAGGLPGKEGTNLNCSTKSGSPGTTGLTQGTFGYGDPGEVGQAGSPGKPGSFTRLDGPCVPDACDPDQFWSQSLCECRTKSSSPVLIDVNGDGFDLTDTAGGVYFDLSAAGSLRRWSWTAAGSDDAWLALDRNGNGTVDDGRELFGDSTPQTPSDEPNGFLALAVYDEAWQGGDGDGAIAVGDAVFDSLRLWRDANHNGVSEADELHTLASLNVARLHLDYKVSKRVDGHGNQFRFRAKVDEARGAKAGRWAWDVFLVSTP